MGRAERKARARAKRQKDAVKVLRRGMGDVQEFLMAHRRKQEHREGQFRREVAFRALQMRGRFGGVRDQQRYYKISDSFLNDCMCGSIGWNCVCCEDENFEADDGVVLKAIETYMANGGCIMAQHVMEMESKPVIERTLDEFFASKCYTHNVKCYGCGEFPIEGSRYKSCYKAIFYNNVHLCSACKDGRFKEVECTSRRWAPEDPWWTKYLSPSKEDAQSESESCSSEQWSAEEEEEDWSSEEEAGFKTPEKMVSGKPPPTCTPDPTCATAKGASGRTLSMATPQKAQ
mgnify:CR=1 FL=1